MYILPTFFAINLIFQTWFVLPWPRLYLLVAKWSPADIDTIDTDKRQIDRVLWLVRTCPLRPLIGCQGSSWVCHQASQAHLHSHPDKWLQMSWEADKRHLTSYWSVQLSSGLSLVRARTDNNICFQWSQPEISSFLHH